MAHYLLRALTDGVWMKLAENLRAFPCNISLDSIFKLKTFYCICIRIEMIKLDDAFGFFLKVHKIENFFDSDFGICVISLLVMSKYKDFTKKIFGLGH